MMKFFSRHPLISLVYNMGVVYPAPTTLSYLWNFGSLALLCLVVQLVTGILLAMYYVANVELAFDFIEHLMKDVNYGWLLRYVHANGASMFFFVVYVHIFRGFYYGSYMYPREMLWGIGVVILFLMIGTAFMGYVLPWGQMSFWAATVITNLTSAVPFIGKDIVLLLWGAFSVDNSTLNRFFSIHYLLPFVLVTLVLMHLILLHEDGSNNPFGCKNIIVDKVPFTPYFTVKDIFGVVVFFILFFYLVSFDPNLLGHPDNYIIANPLSTPAHIVPEWYFLPFYAILRSVPDKLGGVILMVASILILILMPYLVGGKIRSSFFRPLHKVSFWFFVSICMLLGWIGGNPADYPYVEIGQCLTVFYFMFILLVLPFLNFLEKIVYFYNFNKLKRTY